MKFNNHNIQVFQIHKIINCSSLMKFNHNIQIFQVHELYPSSDFLQIVFQGNISNDHKIFVHKIIIRSCSEK